VNLRILVIISQLILLSLLAACSTAEASPLQPAAVNEVFFEGKVTVFSTDLEQPLWQRAGWKISHLPLNTERQEIPLDCTLYPHEGVSNQWIGSCMGAIRIPKEGADHIALMITGRDGTTTMVQVAPEPTVPIQKSD
jgi:hypothetical protein